VADVQERSEKVYTPIIRPTATLTRLMTLLTFSRTKSRPSEHHQLRRRRIYDVPHRSTLTITDWSVVTSDEVEKLIGLLPNKTCQSDTWLVKEMGGLLSFFICFLFNKSFATGSGCFSQEFKEAVVRPLLKKSELDASELKNYSPVSNIPFVSITGESRPGSYSGLL